MLETIKKFLKCLFPPPTRAFNREVERIISIVQKQSNEIKTSLAGHQNASETLIYGQLAALESHQKANEILLSELISMMKENHEQMQQFSLQLNEVRDFFRPMTQLFEKRFDLVLENQGASQKCLMELLLQTRYQAVLATRTAQEAIWANVFHDTISQSSWLSQKNFSPGRWAVGYPILYVMYRILNEVRPKHILELGLGQSTRMISQYAAAFDDVEHIVIEHDQEWIDFFTNDFSLSPRSHIIRLDREMVPFKDAEQVRVFSGFQEVISGKKFDFILIDAPFGGDMKQYARIDVLGSLPECLSNSFVILIDDCNRNGEKNTVQEMKLRLKKYSVEYEEGIYRSEKDSVILTSKDIKFLCSM